MNRTRITGILVSTIVIILTAVALTPSAAYAYRDGKSQTDLKIPANTGGDTGVSVVPLAGQNTITTQADNGNNNNNRLNTCTNQPSQNTGTVPPFCVGHLVVIKHVINDNGGTSIAKDFTIGVSRPFPGAESPGTNVTLTPGPFSVNETGPAGYTQSLSGDCSGTINPGDNKVCTVTNNDKPQTVGPSITVTSVTCADITATQRGVAIDMTISGVSHDSHSLTYVFGITSPTGNFATSPSFHEITIPANAPDPASTFIGTNFISSPDNPTGTYKIIAIISGDIITTTFQAPDCSQQ